MFCPNCNAEYVTGITMCSDCNVALVQDLSTANGGSPWKGSLGYEEVLYTFNPADIAFMKSILDAEEITYYFHGEHFSQIRPLALPARLMVMKDQVESAKEILKDAKLSIMAINTENDARTEEEADQ